LEVVLISTCPVAPLVNFGAVDAEVIVCVPVSVPDTFVIFAPNFVRYAAAVALVPEKRIQYQSCPRSCRLFCAFIHTVEYGHTVSEGIVASSDTVPVTTSQFALIVAIAKLG